MDELDAVLEALAAGDISVAEARDRLADLDEAAGAAALAGVAELGEFARVDTAMAARTGVPEVVDADRKATEEVVAIGTELLDAAGLAILTNLGRNARERIEAAADEVEWDGRSRTLVGRMDGYEPPSARGQVAVVSAGTSDIPTAQQAVILAREMGCTVETRYDVGVSSLGRLYAELDTLRASDCVVVAAGREGALATVVAGLVDVPVIGLPVGTGTGFAGNGEAALMGMLQSCTFLSVVNVDAGFAAGAQAALIAA